jgi:BirA family biotin operon repressor/biotin-[acetyl-CoA-carboxylase] ligase
MSPGPAPVLPSAFRLVALERVESTNDAARALAQDGAADGALVWALEQTKGRGRQGRSWASPRGNLYCSLVLRPDCALARASELSFVAALAVGGALEELAPPGAELRYKWPNDVLLNGRKTAGILLESAQLAGGALDFLILGVGVNLTSSPGDAAFPATSLSEAGCQVVEPPRALEALARHFLAWRGRWLADGFAPVRAGWLARAWRLGQTLELGLGGETLAGRFRGVGPDGTLELELPGGALRRVAAGDVRQARPGAGRG